MDTKKFVKSIAYKLVDGYKQRVYKKHHQTELNNYVKYTNVTLVTQPQEKRFIEKWRPLYADLGEVSVGLYRFYSHFLGDDPNIITDDVFHIFVEPCLNSQEYIAVYGDKNMYDKLLPRDYFPVCVLRNMEGDYMDRDYRIINMDNAEFNNRIVSNETLRKKGKLIVKPTTETGGGTGVRLFHFDDGKWISNDGVELTFEELEKKYKRNFVIQETLEPCDFVKQFNPSSYSTFRIFTYRSVVDDATHFIGGYIRIGAKGNFKDNVWGGGYVIPIMSDGLLGKFASDAKRKRYDNVNGITLEDKTFKIPNWPKIIDLCTDISSRVIPCRLLSFDIMLDSNNTPHAVEFNIKNQTVTTVQTTSKVFFGEYTDEVIEYCKRHKESKRIYPITVSKP